MDKDLKAYLESLTSKKLSTSDKHLISQNDPDVQRRKAESNRKHRQENPYTAKQKKRIGDAMRGKTLEEIVGEEAAARGRKARSEASKGKKRPPEVGQKIAATRKANGSYVDSGMTGKKHKESTKAQQSTKAQVRQDLKRKLGLGRNDSIPRELLEKEYKKRGL